MLKCPLKRKPPKKTDSLEKRRFCQRLSEKNSEIILLPILAMDNLRKDAE